MPNVTFLTPTFCQTLLKGRKSPRAYKLTLVAGDDLREHTFTKCQEPQLSGVRLGRVI